MSTHYYGDNPGVLHRQIACESANLVYLAPPSKSDRNYYVLFHKQDGSR